MIDSPDSSVSKISLISLSLLTREIKWNEIIDTKESTAFLHLCLPFTLFSFIVQKFRRRFQCNRRTMQHSAGQPREGIWEKKEKQYLPGIFK